MVDIGGYTIPGTDPNNPAGGSTGSGSNPLNNIAKTFGLNNPYNAGGQPLDPVSNIIAGGIDNTGSRILSDINNNVNTNGFGGNGGTFDPQNLVNNMYNSINQTLTNFGLPKDQVGATITNDLGNIADFITGVSQQKNQAWQNQVVADAAAQQATNLANQRTQQQQTDLAESNAVGALRANQPSQGSGPVLATNPNGVAVYQPASASSVAQRDFLGLQ